MALFQSRRDKEQAAVLADLSVQSVPLLELCHFAIASVEKPAFPCRHYLSHLHREATRLEEMLDHYGAQTNSIWFPYRESVAAAKLFSSVTYAIKHIKSALDHYNLMSIESDCKIRTDAVLASMTGALISISHNIINQATLCGIPAKSVVSTFKPCTDEKLIGRLAADRTVRHIANVGEFVVSLATKFLNLSEDRDVRAVLREPPTGEFAAYVPDPISEERLRIVESRFHNLQSLYDTYIFESDIEQQNTDLRYLRGHISAIYHLAETATNLAHYYIRHMSPLRRATSEAMQFPMSANALLALLFEYPLYFSRLYLESAVQLCRKMIRSYSVQAEIEVPIPNYRGFHVRPSTLVAGVVAHYGSEVTMSLDKQQYNAALPLDLFRANEAINAVKRRHIADMLCQDPELNRPFEGSDEERVREIQLLLMRLMSEKRVVVYDSSLEVDDLDFSGDATLAESATHCIRHLVSVAKMDVISNIMVQFKGDSRALRDLEILAAHGYGEDELGNNVVLPEELAYLSRQSPP